MNDCWCTGVAHDLMSEHGRSNRLELFIVCCTLLMGVLSAALLLFSSY